MSFLLLVLVISSVYGFLRRYEQGHLLLRDRTWMLCEGASSKRLQVVSPCPLSHKSVAAPVTSNAWGDYIIKDVYAMHRVRHAHCAGEPRVYDSRAREFLDPVRLLTQDEARRMRI
jgi:hypothetical protein